MKKIYLAGKITDLPFEVAVENFADAEQFVTAHGYVALNPMTLVQQAEWARNFDDDSLTECERPYNDMLLDALRIVLTDAEAIFMLENWQTSKGARIEHAIARELGIPVFYAATLGQVTN